ncbi:unnamed protein product [Merluccius merluccius]
MSLAVDETAGDLPVKDVGLTRGGLMPSGPDSVRDVKPWKKPQIMNIKDRQRLFRVPRDHLEDMCLRLQEENVVLRQHTHTQEQRLRRMSTRLMRLRGSRRGAEGLRERDTEDTIQDLEMRVATLESQKGALQSKLSLARQHLLDLGGRGHYRLAKGRRADREDGVRRAAQTAPPRYGATQEDTWGEIEKLSSVVESQQVRVAELEVAAQALRDKLQEKEREREEGEEDATRGARRQQAHGHRLTIRDNVDLIRLQRQLTEKSTALRVAQEKFHDLQEAYENQLEESQRGVQESQGAVLGRLEELSEELREERQRALGLEAQLTSATLALQTLHELQERISDLEGERTLLKESYDTLLQSTLSAKGGNQKKQIGQSEAEAEESDPNECKDIWKKRRKEGEKEKKEVERQDEMLRLMAEERRRLEEEKERLREAKEALEERRERGRGSSEVQRERPELQQQELQQYKQQVTFLQDRLDSVTQVFDMSLEDLSDTLLQIKAFRLQQEARQALGFLEPVGGSDGGGDPGRALGEVQAAHAETVLELHKTRELLLLEHRITTSLQEELDTVNRKRETEREESRRRVGEKDKILSKRALQINTLQAQLKELAYSPKNYKRSIPIQYTWPGGDQEVVQPIEDDTSFSQLRPGESMLEIHLKTATFTPGGLRTLGAQQGQDLVTFCTYGLLDYEVHCTPLVSGTQPSYGFTSRYALSAHDLARLRGAAEGSKVRVELHQAMGGVRFSTLGSGGMPLAGALERRGERVSGCVNVTGSEGDIVGVVDFWVRLFPPAVPVDVPVGREPDQMMFRGPATQTGARQHFVGWQDIAPGELFDYGGGIPNELVIAAERCVGLSGRWPGLLPDAYLTYRFYDLPPHVSPTVQCCADPTFNDTVSYPLAVTTDVLQYLSSGSLWVYVFDDSDDQVPPVYLAKTPVPLRTLATGREIRGDYVLRDAGGGPRGMVRVLLKWRYPFQPPGGSTGVNVGGAWLQQKDRETERETDRRDSGTAESRQRETRRREEEREESQRPVAKPRVKYCHTYFHPKQQPAPIKLRRPQESPLVRPTTVTPSSMTLPPPSRKRTTKRSPDSSQDTPPLASERRQSTPPRTTARKSERVSSERLAQSRTDSTQSATSSVSDARSQDASTLEQVSMDQEEHEEEKHVDSEAGESSSSSHSDVIVFPPKRKIRKGDKLKVEILSLTFGPSSHVARDQSVQRVYVEYRLLGVPMATTETPMSLRKPAGGEEIHYNFTRVIYVDGSESASLRQYLYTMLEGTDPSQGRLKFTVVSEPMDDDEGECVDVGHAFLDLQELLLTGNDVVERQIDIVSVDEERDCIGKLKVSLEAAKALTGIYREFHRKEEPENEGGTTEEEEDEEEQREEKKEPQIKVDDYDEDSDFF